MEVKAKLSFNRQSPTKVRQVANLIRGMHVPVAQSQLISLQKVAAKTLGKLLASAVANAKNRSGGQDTATDWFVKEIRVDQGPTYKRFQPKAHGRATPVRKRTSHISIVLDQKNPTIPKSSRSAETNQEK